jgi:hypothetical protein
VLGFHQRVIGDRLPGVEENFRPSPIAPDFFERILKT